MATPPVIKPLKIVREADPLPWSTPGSAISVVHLKKEETPTHTALFITQTPGIDASEKVHALIGDLDTKDDTMHLDLFEPVFRKQEPAKRFIAVTVVNKSGGPKEFEIAYIFGSDAKNEYRYAYSVPEGRTVYREIAVELTD